MSGDSRGRITLWNIKGEQLFSWKAHSKAILKIAVSSNGELIASSSVDNIIKVWDYKGENIREFEGHTNFIFDINFDPDSKIIGSTSYDGSVRLWFLDDSKESITFETEYQRQLRYKKALNSSIYDLPSLYGLDFSHDGNHIVATNKHGNIYVWNINGKLVKTLQTLEMGSGSNTPKHYDVAISPDNKIIAVTQNGNITGLYKMDDGMLLRLLKGHNSPINKLAFKPDGQTIATASDDHTVKLWDINTGSLITTLRGHSASVWSVDFSRDGEIIATASKDKTVRLWDLTGKQLLTVQGSSGFTDVEFNPKSDMLVATSNDKNVQLWNFDLVSLLEQGCIWINDYLTSNDYEQSICKNITYSASTLLEQGKKLARSGLIDEAVVQFQAAMTLDASLHLNPKSYASQLNKATQLISEGIDLALKNEIVAAIEKFKKALELDSGLTFDPELKAKRLAVPFLVIEGKELASNIQIDDAIAKLQEASKLDPKLKIDPKLYVYELAIQALLNKGIAFEEKGKLDMAISACLKAKELFQTLDSEDAFSLDLDNIKINLWYMIGHLFLKTGNLKEAKNHFLDLLKFDVKFYFLLPALTSKEQRLIPDIDAIYYFIGIIEQQEKNINNALMWHKKVEKGTTYYFPAQIQVAIILSQQRHFDEALQYLQTISTTQQPPAKSWWVRV